MIAKSVTAYVVLGLVVGCGSSPGSGLYVLTPDRPVTVRSDDGLVDATVALDAPGFVRGPNIFRIALSPTQSPHVGGNVVEELAVFVALSGVSAWQPLDGRAAGPAVIAVDGYGWRTTLPLEAEGRWEVEIDVLRRSTPDRALFVLDVP